jgi:hypothetical protein
MANPRAGSYDPLNPLSLHSESRYRNGNYSLASETQVFNVPLGIIKAGAKGSAKLGVKGFKGGIKGLKFSGTQIAKLKNLNLSKGAAKVTDDVAEGGVKGGADTIQESVKAGGKGALAKTGLTIGANVVTIAFAGLIYFGGKDAIEAVTDNFTGMNCDDKAKEAGYTEGSDEYKEFVEKCQNSAANKLALLGYGAMILVGVVGFVIISRYLPKKKSDEGE